MTTLVASRFHSLRRPATKSLTALGRFHFPYHVDIPRHGDIVIRIYPACSFSLLVKPCSQWLIAISTVTASLSLTKALLQPNHPQIERYLPSELHCPRAIYG